MGFILWLKQGYADCLEGYAFGDDSTTELAFETVRFTMKDPPASSSGRKNKSAPRDKNK